MRYRKCKISEHPVLRSEGLLEARKKLVEEENQVLMLERAYMSDKRIPINYSTTLAACAGE